MGAYPQRIHRDLKPIGKVLTKFDLRPFLFLIVINYQISILGRQGLETPVEARNARVRLNFCRYFLTHIVNRLFESDGSVLLISERLHINHSRHPIKITLEAVDGLTFGDPASDAIYRLVGMVVRRVDPSPFEEANESTPHHFILCRRLIAVRRKRIKEFLESVLR